MPFIQVSGTGAIDRSGVLRRRLHQASCLTRHVSVNADSCQKVGQVRAGLEPLDRQVQPATEPITTACTTPSKRSLR